MTSVSVKLDSGSYIGSSTPKESIKELVEHYVDVYKKNNEKIMAMVICTEGTPMVGFRLLGP